MAKFVLIDGKPAPAKLGPVLTQLKEDVPGLVFNSILRTQKAVDWARSQGATLSSQRELYNGFVLGLPGYNPANRPGTSTHERRNDGVAYPHVPIGAPIPYWAVGLDVDDAHVAAACAAGRARGWIVTVTYPGSASEYHHLNFRKRPVLSVWVAKPLSSGSRGRRVRKVVRRLRALGYVSWPASRRDRNFSAAVERAVRAFQSDHHLGEDGVVGLHTWRQLQAMFAKRRKGA